jgi:hypothetical protein
MPANRRAMIAGLAVLSVLALAIAVDTHGLSGRPGSKTEVALAGIEPGGLARAALKPSEDQGAKGTPGIRFWLLSFIILAGQGLFLARRRTTGPGRVHVAHGYDSGPVWVRGPPLQLV